MPVVGPLVLGYIFFGGGVVMAYPQFRQGVLALRKDSRSLVRKVKRRARARWRGRDATKESEAEEVVEVDTPRYAVYTYQEAYTRFPRLGVYIPSQATSPSSKMPMSPLQIQSAVAVVASTILARASSNHSSRFFVLWSHDTPWRTAFSGIVGPDVVVATDLFALMRLMLCVRADLADAVCAQRAKSKTVDTGSDVVFYLLVVSVAGEALVIPRRLRLDAMLAPLVLEGVDVARVEGDVKKNLKRDKGRDVKRDKGKNVGKNAEGDVDVQGDNDVLVWVNLAEQGESVELKRVANLAALPGGFPEGGEEGAESVDNQEGSRGLFAAVEGVCV